MRKSSSERRERFVHLGDRLAYIERIRTGLMTCAEAAGELGIDEEQVLGWLSQHANDRVVSIEELRVPADRRNAKLAARARRLAHLLALAARRVRELHLELISKEFGGKPHRDFDGVARVQPSAE